MSFDKNGYDNQYKRDKYDRISLLVPKGGKATLQKVVAERGEKSVNALIIRALELAYGIQL